MPTRRQFRWVQCQSTHFPKTNSKRHDSSISPRPGSYSKMSTQLQAAFKFQKGRWTRGSHRATSNVDINDCKKCCCSLVTRAYPNHVPGRAANTPPAGSAMTLGRYVDGDILGSGLSSAFPNLDLRSDELIPEHFRRVATLISTCHLTMQATVVSISQTSMPI
jgi:hypothetical protein